MDPKLYQAAINGDLTYLQTLQETSSNLHSHRTPSLDTILHVATEFHQTEFARAAVEACPGLLWQVNISGDTALHIAAAENHADMVLFFVNQPARSDVEIEEGGRSRELILTRMVNLEKDTALHCAVRNRSYKSLKLLLIADAEVCGFVNDANESPLYLSTTSEVWNMPEILIRFATSSTSHTGPNGLTALHSTLYFADYPLEKIETLVKWRTEMIREGDDLGLTPLHYAALYGAVEATKLFLKYDRSAVYVLNNDGESALHIAAVRGHTNVLKELINFGMDCYNMIDNKGRTILHAAVLGETSIATVKYILETPMLAKLINKKDKDGNTPLHIAASFRLYEAIQILAKNKNVNLGINNFKHMTPLDVFNQHREEGIKAEITRFNLRDERSTVNMQRLAKRRLEMMNKEPSTTSTDQERTSRNRDKRGDDVRVESALEVNLLVATLVATVTFTAGFTMPGGLINNEENEGLATLTNKPTFQAFFIFNTLAFCCSVFAVLLQLHTSLGHYHTRVRYTGLATSSTTFAILAMVLAFSFGSHVVLTRSIMLSLTPYLICGCFVVVYSFIPLADPGVKGYPSLDRLQKSVRGIIIRYGGKLAYR